MNINEANEILKEVSYYYNMDWENQKDKFKMWRQFLVDNGDYKKSREKVKQRILSGNQYTPTMAEIISQDIKSSTPQKTHNIRKRGELTQKEIEERRKIQQQVKRELEEKEISLNDL